MDDANFGKSIDDYQRKKSEYGSALLKKTETDDELKIEPVKWKYTYVDFRDITRNVKIEQSFFSFLELKKKRESAFRAMTGEESKAGVPFASDAPHPPEWFHFQ